MTLRAMVSKIGHEVIVAENGAEALTLFDEEQPGLVLMDVLMPHMDGYECAKAIKQRCGERFVPIIFLTGLTEDEELARCVESGGDDFLVKPYKPILIKAKIDAMERIHNLYGALAESKKQLEKYHVKTEKELHLAHHIFQEVTMQGASKTPAINQWFRPAGLFNGDLLVAEYNPAGQLHVMLGDFTGHGLAAAIGVIPTADIFFAMTKKGFGIGEIAAEINKKLKRVLPTGYFCAASLASIDRGREIIEIWNGGLPPVLAVDEQGRIMRRITSGKLPLGVVTSAEFDQNTEILPAHRIHSLLLYSDGLIEARNGQEKIIGQDGLEKIVRHSGGVEKIFNSIKEGVMDFIGSHAPDDDISLLEIKYQELLHEEQAPLVSAVCHAQASSWSLEMNLNGDIIGKSDPLPLFMGWLIQADLPDSERRRIYMVLAELINNAVDHGLLKLDSGMKSDPEGFENYYLKRRIAMDQLVSGAITVRLEQLPADNGRVIKVLVKDSGGGFNFNTICSRLDKTDKYFGRGIALVRSLCSRLTYQGCGNSAEAECYISTGD